MAMAYTTIEQISRDGVMMEHPIRRLRIVTKPIQISTSIGEIYRTINPDIVVVLLIQQLIHISLEQGMQEARDLIRDWLIYLITRYNIWVKGTAKPKQWTIPDIDITFNACPNLQFISRFIMAIIKNNLLCKTKIHPDKRVFAQCLYR